MVKVNVQPREIALALGFSEEDCKYIRKLTIVIDAECVPIVIAERIVDSGLSDMLVRRIRVVDDTESEPETPDTSEDGPNGGAVHSGKTCSYYGAYGEHDHGFGDPV